MTSQADQDKVATRETYYDVYDEMDRFLMRAPLLTITKVWNLRDAAVARIERECNEPGGVCSMHANGRAFLGGDHILIQLAVGPRANY